MKECLNTKNNNSSFHLLQNSGFRILYWNVQSIVNKIDYIIQLINDLKIDIFCVSEHWLASYELSLVKIPGFNLIDSYCRQTKGQHGGSAIFAKDDILINNVIDFTHLATNNIFEVCGSFIVNINSFCICIYRTPDNNSLFLKPSYLNFMIY